MQIDSVKKYLTSSVKMPYFLFIGDGQYANAMDELSIVGFDLVAMSGFCNNDDKMPDIDGLFTYIKAAGANGNQKKFVVTGLGEFLALRGSSEAARTLSRLKDYNVGDAKVVLLLRGLSSLITGMQTDPRFDSRRFSVVDKAECDLSFTLAAPSVGLSALSGFKAMLAELENGRCGIVAVNTAVNLDKSIFTVHQISTAYDGIKFLMKSFALERSCGSDARWAELLTELNQSNGSLNKVFEKHNLGDNLESDLYARTAGSDFRNWLYFIYLKCNVDKLKHGYLRIVLDKTSRFEEFTWNVLNALTEIQHTDARFDSLYRERKALIEKFPESNIADFVVNSRQVVSESIYKLTDGSRVEREEIIAWLSKNNMIPQLDVIYPVLAAYLNKYIFKCPELADVLTEYFEEYKQLKLLNKIEPEFLKKVDDLALSRKYNRLPTRNEIMDSMDKNDTFLYWLDALGVEYLSLIEDLVQKRGLSIRVNIARIGRYRSYPYCP